MTTLRTSVNFTLNRTFNFVFNAPTSGQYRVDGGAWVTHPATGSSNWGANRYFSRTFDAQSDSGTEKSIRSPEQLLVEWDSNSDGTPDQSAYVEVPEVMFTWVYGGGFTSSYVINCDPATLTFYQSGELDQLSYDDPLQGAPDTDGDGLTDDVDPDDDNDGIPDPLDLFPLVVDDGSDSDRDTDGDTIPDVSDPDDDNDGTLDADDAFPTDPNEDTDADGDGVGGNTDPDDNDYNSRPGDSFTPLVGGDNGSGWGSGDRSGTLDGWPTLPDPDAKAGEFQGNLADLGVAIADEVGSWQFWNLATQAATPSSINFDISLGPLGTFSQSWSSSEPLIVTIRTLAAVMMSFAFFFATLNLLNWK